MWLPLQSRQTIRCNSAGRRSEAEAAAAGTPLSLSLPSLHTAAREDDERRRETTHSTSGLDDSESAIEATQLQTDGSAEQRRHGDTTLTITHSQQQLFSQPNDQRAIATQPPPLLSSTLSSSTLLASSSLVRSPTAVTHTLSSSLHCSLFDSDHSEATPAVSMQRPPTRGGHVRMQRLDAAEADSQHVHAVWRRRRWKLCVELISNSSAAWAGDWRPANEWRFSAEPDSVKLIHSRTILLLCAQITPSSISSSQHSHPQITSNSAIGPTHHLGIDYHTIRRAIAGEALTSTEPDSCSFHV